MSFPRFKTLKFNGSVSVRPVTEMVPRESLRYLIMGPTGAGKSSFIEALGGDSHGLNISGGQLESVTQQVTAYELVNVRRGGWPIYIIDTPGFSDVKLSEGEIFDMVKTWIQDNNVDGVGYVIFLMPINDTRLSGSKRQTMAMMRELIGGDKLTGMTFVTTMWDNLFGERVHGKAESKFKQLEQKLLKEWIDEGATLTKFDNNQSSALAALDLPSFRRMPFYSQPGLLYPDLCERISTALQDKEIIKAELVNPDINSSLKTLLEKNQVANEDLLIKHIGRLRGYEEPPEGYENVHANVSAAIVTLGDELQRMEERVRERQLALGHQPQHEVLVMRDYQQCLQAELEAYQRRLQSELEVYQRRLLKSQPLSFRLRQKVEKATTSITGVFRRAT